MSRPASAPADVGPAERGQLAAAGAGDGRSSASVPVHADEQRAVASVQPPGVVLIEIVLGEPLQQDDALLPFACSQAVIHGPDDPGSRLAAAADRWVLVSVYVPAGRACARSPTSGHLP